MGCVYEDLTKPLTFQNSYAASEGSKEDDDTIYSVMAEHQNQDVDSQLAQLVVGSTTSVDETKQTSEDARVERKQSPDNAESENDILDDKARESMTPPDTSSRTTRTIDSDERDASTQDLDVAASSSSRDDTDGSSVKKDDEKPVTRTSSFKKPISIKPTQLNKAFLAGGTTGQNGATHKLSLSMDKGSKSSSTQSSAAATPKPRLIGKMASGLTRTGPLGLSIRKNGDSQPVWNKNQPIAPAPAKEYTDEELSKKYGIHMASRLQSEDASKESKWADIDDDDEDWMPEVIEWTDGSKMTLPQPEEETEATLEKPALDEPTEPKEVKEVKEPELEPKLPKFVEKRFSPLPSNRDSIQSKQQQQQQLPPQAPPVQETPRPGPWAPIPSGVPFPTPRPLITQAFPAAGSSSNRQVDSQRPSAQPSPSTKEVATDDFNRAWREPGPPQSRELFIPETGKLEPVQESNRNRDNRQRPRPDQPVSRPSVLQRPNSNSTQTPGPAEPSSAFQQQRTPYRPDEARRRRASSGAGSATLNAAGRRSSINRTVTNGNDADIVATGQIFNPVFSRTAVEEAESNRISSQPSQGPPPWSRSSMSQPQENPPPSSPIKPETTLEDPIVMQQRIMKESREAAAKRRKEEEKAEEEAKQERLRKKLEQLGHFEAVEKSKEKTSEPPILDDTDQSAPVTDSEKSVSKADKLPQTGNSDRPKTPEKIVEQKTILETSKVQTVLPPSTAPEKQVNEPWRSTSAGNKGWSGSSRQNNNPWHPVEGEQRRFPQLDSLPLPFNSISEKSLHRDPSSEQSQNPIEQQNKTGLTKISNPPVRPDNNFNGSQSNINSAQSEYSNRSTHSNSHLPHLSPQQHHQHLTTPTSLPASQQQQEHQHQPSHPESKLPPTNTLTQTNHHQSYHRDSSRNTEREQAAQYTHRQDMRGQNATRNRNDTSLDSRGHSTHNSSWLSGNSDQSSQASMAWQTAAYDIQRNEALEKEKRRVERLAQEETSIREGGEKPPSPLTATIETTWRRVEVGKDGRRRYVGVVKSGTEQGKPESSALVNDKEGSENMNQISQSISTSAERHHPIAFSQGPSVMLPQFSPPAPGPMRHVPSSGLPMPRSRFFPGSMVPMPGQHPGTNEHAYSNTVEPMVMSPPTMHTYPHHNQQMVNQSSVVVTLPPQQQSAHNQHGMSRFNSPPHMPATLAHKIDNSASQLASTSSKSAFEMVQSKILGMVRPVGSHSRDASTELQGDVLEHMSLVGEPTSLELETTSKPSFDEFREEKVTVSLPGTSKLNDTDTRGWEYVTQYEAFTLPDIDDLVAELFPQDFGSLPTVRLPSSYPDALKDPARSPPETGRGSKNGKKKLEVLSVDRDAGPLFHTTNDYKEKLFFVKLDANAARSEAYLLKNKFNAHRRISGGMKPNAGRGNYKMGPKPIPNSHYAQPPTYPPMGPMLHNMNHGFPPRGVHPQNSNPNRMLCSPRKISGAV